MQAGAIEIAAAVGVFAAGLALGLGLAHFILRYRREEFDRAMERAEYLLRHDAIASAKELESSLSQLSTAAEATRIANDRARAAEARVAALSGAFRTLRSDPTISRLSGVERPKKRLAPRVTETPAGAKRPAPQRFAEAVIVDDNAR